MIRNSITKKKKKYQSNDLEKNIYFLQFLSSDVKKYCIIRKLRIENITSINFDVFICI